MRGTPIFPCEIVADDDDAALLQDVAKGPITPWEQRTEARRIPTQEPAPAPLYASEFTDAAVPVQPMMETPSTIEVLLGHSKKEEGIVSLDDLKRQAVERAYRLCDGNVDRAAVELGIGRATMYRLLKKFGILEV